MNGWHFVAEDRHLGYDDGRLVRVGKTLTVDCDPVLCEAGLHAGYTAYDALQYAQGPVLCRVRLGGTIVRGHNKAVATERTVLKMADVSHVLHEFACRCAEDELALTGSSDPRSIAAIETKRRWLRGEASDDELDTARDAAWASAWAAAWAASRDAVRAAAWAVQKRRLAAMLGGVEWETPHA